MVLSIGSVKFAKFHFNTKTGYMSVRTNAIPKPVKLALVAFGVITVGGVIALRSLGR